MNILKKTVSVLLPSMRISFALVLLTTCLLLSAEMLGFTPDESKYLLDARKQVSESLAIQFSILAPDVDAKKIHKILTFVVKRNPEMLSAGIRLHDGELIFQVGDHATQWRDYDKKKSTSTHLIVPILQNGQAWGNIEIKFAPLQGKSSFSFLKLPIFKLGSFILIIGFFVYLGFMLRTLKMLDPSAVVPERVHAAFDSLSEGVIILDEYEQIVLVNKSFAEKIGRPISSFLGIKASKLKWQSVNPDLSDTDFPWQKSLKTGSNSIGTQYSLASSSGKEFRFVINASPIQAGNAVTQGVLVTLDDITELEERNSDLLTMVYRLEETQAQVQEKNKELHFLATRDPLTGCLNRRSFNEQFENTFKTAQQTNSELSCIMADIDHFKAVNDNFGHATGDVVIQLLAEILHSNTRKIDLVGRYGGEEFCVVLPDLTDQEAIAVAERIRLRMKDESAARFENGPKVTVSLGLATIKDNPATPAQLNNFADEALYVAKQSGRNRVIRWHPDSEPSNIAEGKTSQSEIISQPENNKIEKDNLEELQLKVKELEHIAAQFSAEIEYSKNYDPLTGLPNQTLFYDRISQIIERGYRYDQLAAVLVVDLGMFSQINVSLGRISSDKLLIEIAARLNATFRKSDGITRLTVSRFGGDEFAVLLTELPSKETITWLVKRLLDSLAAPIDIDGDNIFLAGHVGISLYPSDANSVDDLINKAMIAKKHSKQLYAEANYQFFDDSMQELSLKHLNLDKELRLAIQNEEWELLYQPKMDIKTKTIIGAEALIRWKHPARGLLSPYEFIEFAEQRGLILAIGDWVIKTACHQLSEWSKLGIADFKIAVNLSAIQLRQDDFVNKVFHTLAENGIPPRLLELEVTETTLMSNFQTALESLKRLNSRGIKIAIDDFGTGYSSLNYLKNLPINTVKIDRIFVKDLCNNESDKQIVNAVINMAHSMNLIVVAEGVEQQDQLDLLTLYNCDEIQGYLLSKPISANQLLEMLNKYSQLKQETILI